MQPKFDIFVNGTINQVTMAAALRRSNTYEKNATDKQRKKFREGLCLQLEKLAKNYKSTVSVEDHLQNIKLLQEFSKSYHSSILIGGKIKLGVAQKALNLYLKLQWSQGKVKKPPHCPLDAVIINKLPSKPDYTWTEMTSLTQYKSLMEKVKKMADADGKSIAEWELVVYQE